MLGRLNERIKKYAAKLPREIKTAIRGLDDEVRYAVFAVLLERGELSFTQLKELLGLKSGSLDHHLDLMKRGGLVEGVIRVRKLEREPDKPAHSSFYRITRRGRRFLECLYRFWDFAEAEEAVREIHISSPAFAGGPTWQLGRFSPRETTAMTPLFPVAPGSVRSEYELVLTQVGGPRSESDDTGAALN